MTIFEKIDAFVASQGNQVGAGAEFAELLKDIASGKPIYSFSHSIGGDNLTEAEFLSRTGGVTIEELFDAPHVKLVKDTTEYVLSASVKWKGEDFYVIYFGADFGDDTLDTAEVLSFEKFGDLYTIVLYEK